MDTKSSETIHELTRAEIARQIDTHSERRREIVHQRAELFTRVSKSGSPPSLSIDERAARAHAKQLLNGDAPASLAPPSELDFSSLDRQLAVEQRGIDIAIKILGDRELIARAAEAVHWAEEHAHQWRQLVRETIVTAARLEALQRAAARLIDDCVDASAINLPMTNMVCCTSMKSVRHGFSGFLPVTPDDLIEAGLKAGVVTQREIDKAKNV
jgi:hypothetical protein